MRLPLPVLAVPASLAPEHHMTIGLLRREYSMATLGM
jgi:hypothetical protein